MVNGGGGVSALVKKQLFFFGSGCTIYTIYIYIYLEISAVIYNRYKQKQISLLALRSDQPLLARSQMVATYEQQLKIMSKHAPAGLRVSTAMHAASVGEERFKKGDCRGASRLLRFVLNLDF